MDSAAPADSAGAASGSAPSLMAVLRELWKELPELLNDRVELLSLELQRAGAALIQAVVLIVAVAILGVTAWLLLWGVIVWALAFAGLHLALALAAALLVNAAAAVWAVMRARSLLPRLGLPATRRHLMITPSPTPRAACEHPSPDEGPELRERAVS